MFGATIAPIAATRMMCPDGKLDVYIADIGEDGLYGYCTTDDPSLAVNTNVCDAHSGVTVKHRSRVAKDPTQPNLRQVHLIHGELIDELVAAGYRVGPGVMGENVTTRGVDLLAQSAGAIVRLGPEAVVEITGLRSPCGQLDGIQDGLMGAVLDRDGEGNLIRKEG